MNSAIRAYVRTAAVPALPRLPSNELVGLRHAQLITYFPETNFWRTLPAGLPGSGRNCKPVRLHALLAKCTVIGLPTRPVFDAPPVAKSALRGLEQWGGGRGANRRVISKYARQGGGPVHDGWWWGTIRFDHFRSRGCIRGKNVRDLPRQRVFVLLPFTGWLAAACSDLFSHGHRYADVG